MDHSKPRPELYNVPFVADSFHDMPYRLVGKSGLRASRVGLGAWKMGYPETGDGARVDERTALAILDRAVELGVTFWDTANRYNNASGNSERIIGAWLRANPDSRRDVVICTKVFGGMDGMTPNHSRLSRLNILESVKACLARLSTDYIDLLYFHRGDGETPVEESLSAVEDLVRAGVVRYLGVSNFSVAELAGYREAEKSLSIRCRVVAVQNGFNLLDGEHKEQLGMLAYCAEHGVSFVAYGPLARGLLTERYLDPGRAKKGDRLWDEGTLGQVTEEKLAKVRKLAVLSKTWGMALAPLVLAYMAALPGMGPVIPSASSVQQLEANAAAGAVALTDQQKEAVAAALAG